MMAARRMEARHMEARHLEARHLEARHMEKARLLDRLPPVRGRYGERAPLDRVTWFRVGGPAEVMFRPADRQDLLDFLKARPADVPVTVIGVGSNLLVRDGGVAGVVVRLGRDFAGIAAEGRELVCGAAALDVNVAAAARLASLGGLEFLSGVPGTIGGALRMNAGAYGRETKDVLVSAEAAGPDGRLHRLRAADMGFAYRRSAPPEDWIFLGARLAGTPDDPAAIQARMAEIRSARGASQPIRARTGGSTFKNPAPNSESAAPNSESGSAVSGSALKAWELIEAAGCRGLSLGGAQVSEQHCNFLINRGGASASDLEDLGEEVRRRVEAATGHVLEWEIRRVGVRPDDPRALGASS